MSSTPKFTKRDFEFIGGTINAWGNLYGDDEALESLVNHFTNYLKMTNGAFSESSFREYALTGSYKNGRV